MSSQSEAPFWQNKRLDEMSQTEWESLCDGCGRCCLHKVEDEDTGTLYATSVACQLLNCKTAQCKDYLNRQKKVPDCVRLTSAKQVEQIAWLPHDCAYKLIASGKNLKWWHHLVSGSRDTVHEAGISIQDKVEVYETDLDTAEDYIPYITHEIS